MTSASSTNVAAGEASNASIDWLVTPTASSAAAAGDQRRGVQVGDAVRVPEPDPTVEHGREVARAPASSGAPSSGQRVDRARPPLASSVGRSGERGPGSARRLDSASTVSARPLARSAAWVAGSAVTNIARRV